MSCARLIQDIETSLAECYQIDLLTSAATFLISEDQLIRHEGSEPPRAAVLLYETEGELEIGLYLTTSLLETLQKNDPSIDINAQNLDAFCVLIEELSHFHLLLQRAHHGLNVSHLELEWQGEIDKLLIAGLWQSQQKQVSCFADLHKQIFQGSLITGGAHHAEAAHEASRCWGKLLPFLGGFNAKRSEIPLTPLRKAYRSSWQDKLRLIRSL